MYLCEHSRIQGKEPYSHGSLLMVSENDAVIGTERLISFSDGVMAVIITIMAFELKVPAHATWHSFSHLVPLLFVYVMSFTFVGIYWVNHHHLLRSTENISALVMWANLHLLFWLSLIPFATAWVGAQHSHSLPASSYGVVGLGAGFAYMLLGQAILKANPNNELITRAVYRDVKGICSLLLYVMSIFLAYVSPYLAYVCIVAVALLWFVPDRRLIRAT